MEVLDTDDKTMIQAIFKAKDIINELKPNKGSIKCPRCGGDLNYVRNKINGHTTGSCKTEGCLQWLE
jgi:hypothetical protein